MIKGVCSSRHDHVKVEWPTEFAALPRIGDFVRGKFGDGFYSLTVAAVVHLPGGTIEVILDLEAGSTAELRALEDIRDAVRLA